MGTSAMQEPAFIFGNWSQSRVTVFHRVLPRWALSFGWLIAGLAALMMVASPVPATGQTITPTTLRTVEAQVMAAGLPATLTCEPGVYPLFFRYAKFTAAVVANCAGATFPGASLPGPTNFTLDGGTFTGRLIVANCTNVTVRHADFPPGAAGIMGRNCDLLKVELNTITGSPAPLAFIDTTNLSVLYNTITDYSGNAGIAAYGGGDILIKGNLVAGTRHAPDGVHPDGIQTADTATGRQHGTVEISSNVVRYVGQGIFGGGTPDAFKAYNNYVMVDYPNALTWKAKVSAEIGNNTLIKLPSALTYTPKFVNYGLLQGVGVAATDGGGNTVNGKPVVAR
jgi:hypothetical protein